MRRKAQQTLLGAKDDFSQGVPDRFLKKELMWAPPPPRIYATTALSTYPVDRYKRYRSSIIQTIDITI